MDRSVLLSETGNGRYDVELNAEDSNYHMT